MSLLLPEKHNNTESPTWVLSDLLSSISSLKEKNEYSIVAKANDLVLLFQQHPNLTKDVQIKTVLPRIQFMLYHPVSEVRSSCYRIIRYLIVNYESLMILVQLKLLIYIIISLSRTRKATLVEMEQSLKLVREFLTVEKGADLISVGLIKTLITIIEENGESDEKYGEKSVDVIPEIFKNCCLETICEISLMKPELVCHSGGFKVLINAMLEKLIEISSSCVMIILKLLDYENSRKFVRNGYDLDSLISIYSNLCDNEDDSPGTTTTTTKIRKLSNMKLQKVSFLISMVLRNFNGIMAYSINDFTSIKNLLMNLRKKNTKARESILDLLLDALRIRIFPWLKNSPIGDSIVRYNEVLGHGESFDFEFQEVQDEFSRNILHHHQGLLTLILVKNGIFQHLSAIIEEKDDTCSTKATVLLTNLYKLASSYLPSEMVNENLLPDLSLHASYEVVHETRHKFTATTEYNQHIRSSLKQINIQSKYNVDDNEFKTMVTNSKILAIKEFEDWNWNILLNLIQGPLTNPKRFDEILEKAPKFFKRLLSFYRPFKYRFSTITNANKNCLRYINFGCQLIEMFLNLENGIKYLGGSKLLPQLSEVVAQIDPYSGISSKDPILSKKRLESTASTGYIRFIGVLSGHSAGIKMLEQWQFFTLFLNIISSTGESDVNNLFVLTLFKYTDFSIDSQFRNLLKMTFKVSNLKVKNYLLKHLLPQLIKVQECETFIVKLLVENLYDTDDIVSKSVDLLFSFFNNHNFLNLQLLIKFKPQVEILEKYPLGKKLLMKFLQFPMGFIYLESLGFLDLKFDEWTKLQGFKYLHAIEAMLNYQFLPYIRTPVVTDDQLYFLQNLLSTEEGLNFFQYGRGKDFLEVIISSTEFMFHQVLHDDDFYDIDNQDEGRNFVVNSLKQNLWIIGGIALGQYGIQLLDPMYNINLTNPIISDIIYNFQSCPIWQIRGICFYVLGMISSTIEGMEILDEFNWVSCMDQYGNSKKLAYPRFNKLVDVFNVEMTNPYRDTRYYHIFNSIPMEITTENDEVAVVVDSDEELIDDLTISLRHKIIVLITNLQAVLTKIENKAIRELNKIRFRYSEIFENDVELFLEIMKLIDKGNFSFYQRSYIFNLFLSGNSKILEFILKKR
ncbi:Target of rapamycin complex 2 subunit ste20 [Candida viswanathii]|uniref:Target of rapamycin complex 2 subunit ste20 n=1 Tax=Candida viswanathii TaxID=5486 RepID=A0A367YCP0_9ASCO|nr:Target of rapamycin complex 2 subunit ste20 [Candida viswanathii]